MGAQAQCTFRLRALSDGTCTERPGSPLLGAGRPDSKWQAANGRQQMEDSKLETANATQALNSAALVASLSPLYFLLSTFSSPLSPLSCLLSPLSSATRGMEKSSPSWCGLAALTTLSSHPLLGCSCLPCRLSPRFRRPRRTSSGFKSSTAEEEVSHPSHKSQCLAVTGIVTSHSLKPPHG